MLQKITTQESIHPLDSRFYPCNEESATYQLEIYHTKQLPNTNIGALNNNTGNFSFNIGDVVDVIAKVNLSNALYLTDVIRNKFLSDLNTRQK